MTHRRAHYILLKTQINPTKQSNEPTSEVIIRNLKKFQIILWIRITI
jgi:hypothetical protein